MTAFETQQFVRAMMRKEDGIQELGADSRQYEFLERYIAKKMPFEQYQEMAQRIEALDNLRA